MNYNFKRIITWENSKATGKAIVSNGIKWNGTMRYLRFFGMHLVFI